VAQQGRRYNAGDCWPYSRWYVVDISNGQSQLTSTGGEYTTVYVNNKAVCKSVQFYGTKPQFTEVGDVPNLNEPHGHGTGHMGMVNSSAPREMIRQHISQASGCVNFGILQPGDIIQVGATYNTTAHSLNLNSHGHSEGWITTIIEFVSGAYPKYA
jgi:hypothetical protein